MVRSLSEKITKGSDLRALALKGLGVEHSKVDRFLNTYNDVTNASYYFLVDWRTSQCDLKKAYINICQALCKAGMPLHIDEVLQ